MAFTYSPNLNTALSRIRFALGDTSSPGLFVDETYTALLLTNSSDEAATIRQAASALATFYATQPDSVSSNGSSVSWRERVSQWNRIALGTAGGAVVADTSVFSYTGRRTDAYSAASSTSEC